MTDETEPLSDPPRRHRGLEILPPAAVKSYCVSVRMNPAEFAAMQPFFAAFADRRMATAMRWLLTEPRVVEVMKEKMREGIAP